MSFNYHQNNRQRIQSFNQNEQATPTLRNKVFSFRDSITSNYSMMESFNAKNYQEKDRHTHEQDIVVMSQKIDKDQSDYHKYKKENPNQISDQLLQVQLLSELVQNVSKFETILQILQPQPTQKNITNPSVLLVNSKDKEKTQTIIEYHQNNNDKKSKIICKNAAKYLHFLDSIDQQYNQSKSNLDFINQSQQEDGIYILNKFEINNQNKNVFFEQSFAKNQQHTKKNVKFQQVKRQIYPQSVQYRKSNINGQYSSNSSNYNQPIQTNSRLYAQEEQINGQSNSNSVDIGFSKVFQPISTPKTLYYENNHQIGNNHSSFNTRSKHKNSHGKYQKVSMNHSSLSNKSLLSNSSKTITQCKFQHKSPKLGLKTNTNKSSKYTESTQKFTISKVKQKNNQKPKTNIRQSSPNNLAWKNLNQTNQFQKMLKMASSNVRPTSFDA